jgi:hypothetical protein
MDSRSRHEGSSGAAAGGGRLEVLSGKACPVGVATYLGIGKFSRFDVGLTVTPTSTMSFSSTDPLFLIAQMLPDGQSLAVFGQVCKRWHGISKSPHLR